MIAPNILQVEDDENDIFLLQHAFQKAGIGENIHVVRDGQEAIDYLRGQGKFSDRQSFPLPCLIILDLKMPRKTGFEVLEWLRAQSGLLSLPVLVLSSSSQPGDIDHAYELGANAFLVKPSSNPERVRLAAAIKEFWLEFNKHPSKCVGEHSTAGVLAKSHL